MAYPTLLTAGGSDPEPISKIEIDRAEDGTGRARSLASDKVRIPVLHPLLSAADKSTLDAYYAANRLLTFSYVSPADGNTYTCMFAKAPAYTRLPGSFWEAKVELQEA